MMGETKDRLSTNSNALPDYLKDLDKSHNIFGRAEYQYLHGLPVRPTKRRPFVVHDIDVVSSCSCSDGNDCGGPVHYFKSFANSGEIAALLIFGLFAALVISAIAFQRKGRVDAASTNLNATAPSRRKNRKKGKRKFKSRHDLSIVACEDTGCVEVVRKQVEDLRSIPSDEVTPCSSQDSEQTLQIDGEDSISPNLVHESDGTVTPVHSNTTHLPAVTIPSTDEPVDKVQNDGCPNSTKTTVLALNHISGASVLCTSEIPMEQLALRWQSKGLDRQKSLELAAQFEE
jgi:hypothetical protein